MEKVLLSDLIERTKEELLLRKPSLQIANAYTFGWKIIERYFTAKGEKHYNKELISAFLQENEHQYENGFIEVHAYTYRKLALKTLEIFFEKGTLRGMRRIDSRKTKYIISEKYEDLLYGYATSLQKDGYRPRTVESLIRTGRRFIHYVESKEHVELSILSYGNMKMLISYMSEDCGKETLKNSFSSLRNFLGYLFDAGVVPVDLCYCIPSYGVSKVKVIEPFTASEEERILASVDRSTKQGKRDYAILLLGIRTGLRSVDVLNLKLEDIDWHKNVINVVQEKTFRPLSLPLFSDVGNAIADYILNTRGESEYSNVFLSVKSPYTPLRDCYNISFKYIKKAGVCKEDDKSKGYHIFRHSLAVKMLSEEVPLTVISNALGHASVESTRPYLCTNAKSLRLCALDFKGIEITSEVMV